LRKLLAYLKPYWKLVVLAPLLMIVEVIVDLLQPTLLAKIVDVGIAGQDLTLVMRTGLFMIGIALIGMLGGMGCTVAASIASQSFGTDLRSDLFKKIQSFSYADLETFKISTLITRLTNDIAQVQMLVLMSLRIMVRAPLLGVGGIIMAISINARLAMILLASVPALLLILFFVIQKSFPLFIMVQLFRVAHS
jgi:ATP-binding cassette subfamily B multidrug efflux pump